MDIRDKVVIITGASGGIGHAAALAFNRCGAKTILVARRREVLQDIALTMPDALVLPADLSKEHDCLSVIEQSISRFGRIDILINNAASIIVSPSESVSRDDLLKAFMTNLLGPVSLTQAVIPHMLSRGGGHIINIGSPGFMMGIPFYTPYVCSKAAFSAWTRTIQAEWKNSSIVISEYFPGYIKTDSKPESRLGEVDQDFLMNSKQNFITRLFAKPKDPNEVAKQLVALARTPKILTYSDFSTKIGAYISNISPFRLSIAFQMANTARKKKNLKMFNL
ncbi:MAG: SDR family NAD(P)-dependent oxidoreductase [Bacteroidetes bacterium]|nr:SDR family NAD(P)-dependent oxidoreductase [Bacteroidota bacterium]